MAVDLTMYSGDSRTLNIEITDDTGAPVDVSTSSDITYGIFKQTGEALVTKTISAGLLIAESVITVTLDPADTADLAGGTYVHECQVTTADDHVYTVLGGTIKILRDYITASLAPASGAAASASILTQRNPAEKIE